VPDDLPGADVEPGEPKLVAILCRVQLQLLRHVLEDSVGHEVGILVIHPAVHANASIGNDQNESKDGAESANSSPVNLLTSKVELGAGAVDIEALESRPEGAL